MFNLPFAFLSAGASPGRRSSKFIQLARDLGEQELELSPGRDTVRDAPRGGENADSERARVIRKNERTGTEAGRLPFKIMEQTNEGCLIEVP